MEYKLSEINYSDTVWRTYFEILAIKALVKKKSIKRIIIFSKTKNNYLSLGLSQHFKKNYYHIYSHNNYYFNFKNFFVTFLIYLSNFGKELILCLLLKCFHKTKIFNSKNTLCKFSKSLELKK